MFDQNTLDELSKNNLIVYRLDVSSSLDIVENSEIFKLLEKKKYNKVNTGSYKLVSNGLLGQKNDIIVDDAKNPKIILEYVMAKEILLISQRKKKYYNDLCKLLKK